MKQTTLYFILDEQKRSGYRDAGNIFWSGVPKPIEYAPQGWNDIGIQNQRNAKYFALDRSVTIPLKFVEDGAQILKNQYYRYGMERNLSLLILKLKLHLNSNLTEYGWYYDLLFMGEFDLSQFKDEGTYVTVNIIEGGIPKYIKANENVKHEFQLDVLEAILVKNDGVLMAESMSFLLPVSFTGADHVIGTNFINQEGNAYGLAHYDVATFNNTGGAIDFANDLHYFLSASQTITGLRLQGKIRFAYSSLFSGGGTIALKTSQARTIVLGTYATGGGTKEVDIDTTFDANAGEKFFLFNDVSGTNSATYEETTLTLSFKSRFKTTYMKALRPDYLFTQLANKITDGNFTAQSNFLDANKNIVLICGDAARGFADAKIKTSLSDFFVSFNSSFSLGLGKLNNKITLEKKSDWIDYTDPINLGDVSDLVASPALDYSFSSIKIGSPVQSSDNTNGNINGRLEFNTTFSFGCPITRVTKEMDLVSIYKKGCYDLENIRINFDGKTAADSNSDNDIWMVHIKEEPITEVIDGVPTLVYELDRSLNASATGIDETATIFNLFLSPKHDLIRNGAFIRSCFYKQDNQWLKFLTTDKQYKLSVTDAGKLIDEDADEEIGGFDAPFFTPNILDFKTQVPVDFLEILDGSPLKAFAWRYLGIDFMGIPVKDVVEPESENSETYQMLSAPTNNLELLEDIFDS